MVIYYTSEGIHHLARILFHYSFSFFSLPFLFLLACLECMQRTEADVRLCLPSASIFLKTVLLWTAHWCSSATWPVDPGDSCLPTSPAPGFHLLSCLSYVGGVSERVPGEELPLQILTISLELQRCRKAAILQVCSPMAYCWPSFSSPDSSSSFVSELTSCN